MSFDISMNTLRSNHYWARDKEFFDKYKAKRLHYSEQVGMRWNLINNKFVEEDLSISQFIAPLRAKVFAASSE